MQSGSTNSASPLVGALNDAIAEGHVDEVILVSEALHEMQISRIAEQITLNATV